MNREQALIQARSNYRAYNAAVIENLFRGAAKPVEATYGHRNGWFLVEGFNFSTDEVSGAAYDHNQSGWAYL